MERVAKKAAPPFLTEQLLPIMDTLRRPQKGAIRASQPQYTTITPDCQERFTISGLSTTPKTAHRGPDPGQGGPPERGGKRPHHSSGGRSHPERASRPREAPSGGRRAGGGRGEPKTAQGSRKDRKHRARGAAPARRSYCTAGRGGPEARAPRTPDKQSSWIKQTQRRLKPAALNQPSGGTDHPRRGSTAPPKGRNYSKSGPPRQAPRPRGAAGDGTQPQRGGKNRDTAGRGKAPAAPPRAGGAKTGPQPTNPRSLGPLGRKAAPQQAPGSTVWARRYRSPGFGARVGFWSPLRLLWK